MGNLIGALVSAFYFSYFFKVIRGYRQIEDPKIRKNTVYKFIFFTLIYLFIVIGTYFLIQNGTLKPSLFVD